MKAFLRYNFFIMMMNWHKRSAYSCMSRHDSEGFKYHWFWKRHYMNRVAAFQIGEEG